MRALPDTHEEFLDLLESGELRAAEQGSDGHWRAREDVKERILAVIKAGRIETMGDFVDKHNLPVRRFSLEHRIRFVPGGSSVRRGAHLGLQVIVMPPSYVNIGAYVGEGSMVDSHVLVGSCAQIGRKVHLSAGVQIGGVLEPVGLVPVVVEDEAFLGANTVVVEGIRVGGRAVIAPGVILSRGVTIYDAVHGRRLERGSAVPPGAVVVPGTRPLTQEWAREQGLQISCPVIVKYRDEKSDAALTLEEVLRS